MTEGDRLAIEALNILAELYVDSEPLRATRRESEVLAAGFALVVDDHPCGDCRLSWQEQAEPCPAHPVRLPCPAAVR